ncbi:D-alanyl-D-alanine carboxypeptidase family protein [Nocardioides massiliensis]|uniref:D-alanyl-D-alanine carboxypeptidase family protein n=1 Tax=Nocardioides massiliensis TaxID=1325935 RepID=UPI0015EC9D4C|nr:D-alanyl-D-alanine carboxypeptidase [Nocardioides massiliensis]
MIRPLQVLVLWMVTVLLVLPATEGTVVRTAPATGTADSADVATMSARTAASGPTQLGPKRRWVTSDGTARFRHRGAVVRPAGLTALPPRVRMRSWIVVDSATGEVLGHKLANQRLPVASLTKLLTAITALDRVPARPVTKVPRWAARQTCSCAGIKPGRRYDRRSLLTGALLTSGNDAAEALAAADPAGRWAFYDAMNAAAFALGATRTHVANASGLTVPGAHSTAADMARVLDAAMARPALARLLGTRGSGVVRNGAGKAHRVQQKTHYVQTYAGAAGKSGYTSASLNTLAVRTTIAVPDGAGGVVERTVDVVTLGAPGGYSTTGTRALATWAATWRDQLLPVGRLPRAAVSP